MIFFHIFLVGFSLASPDVKTITDPVVKSITTSSDALDLLKQQNKYVESVYQWCGPAIDRFNSYLRLLEKFNKSKASMQQRMVIQVLENGINQLTSAQDQLDQETKDKLTDMIRAIGEAKTQIESTQNTIKDVEDIDFLQDVIQNEIKLPVNKFIEKCSKYREQYVSENSSK